MKTPTNPTGEGGGTRPCALGGQPDCNIYIDSSDSSTANSDGDCIWSLAWERGELRPFLRSLRWRSLHRWVSGCRFLTLRGVFGPSKTALGARFVHCRSAGYVTTAGMKHHEADIASLAARAVCAWKLSILTYSRRMIVACGSRHAGFRTHDGGDAAR